MTAQHANLMAIDETLQATIAEVVDAGGGCSAEEYRCILEKLREVAPCSFLVFSCGHDSRLWLAVNEGGRTLFLEDSPHWVDRARKSYGADVRLVKYRTRFHEHNRYLARPDLLSTEDFQFLQDEQWDAVFIDGPIGYGRGPGRMVCFKTVSELPGVKRIFVHDYNRVVERAYALQYFQRFRLTDQVQKLAVFDAI